MRKSQSMIYVDGIPLSAVDNDLVVSSINEGAVSMNPTASSLGRSWGQHLDLMEMRSKDITLTFVAAKPRDLERRATLIDALIRWAAGEHKIKLSYKPDRYLLATCVTFPQIQDLYKWTNALTVTWRAYDVPFWQADQSSKVSTTVSASSSRSQFVSNVGTAETPLRVAYTPTESLHEIYISDGSNTIGINGLNISAGTALSIDVDSADRLVVTAGGTSFLSNVTTDSADLLMVKPGGTTFSVYADAAGTCSMISKARWY